MIEETVKIASNFLRNAYNDDIVALAQILNAEAENDKEVLRDYIECVRTFCDKLYESLA